MVTSSRGVCQSAQRYIQQQEARKDVIERELREKRSALEEARALEERILKAQWAITEAAKRTQQNFKQYVETLVNLALKPIWPRDHRFILDYQIKGRKITAQPLVQDGEEEPQVPKDEMGVSVLDVLAFAFRAVLHSLERPRSRAVMWLDEPMRDMGKGRYLQRAAQMMREISRRLHIQLIINTHEAELANLCDRVFHVRHDGEWSTVEAGDEVHFSMGHIQSVRRSKGRRTKRISLSKKGVV